MDGFTFRSPGASAEVLRDALANTGALIIGRRNFNIAGGWGERHPPRSPMFVVTPSTPEGRSQYGAPFTFLNSVEQAISAAQAAAGEKAVVIASPSIAQQALELGLLDEIAISLVPVILGDGIPFFGKRDASPVTHAREPPRLRRSHHARRLPVSHLSRRSSRPRLATGSIPAPRTGANHFDTRDDQVLEHALLRTRGGAAILVEAERPDEHHGRHAGRGWIHVMVTDADAHYRHTTAAGVEILGEPHDFGERFRGYSARDLEQNHWTFGTAQP
jgi:dihydrofolate reductase/uncharacterized glyoxalase superfamily protein PhnB